MNFTEHTSKEASNLPASPSPRGNYLPQNLENHWSQHWENLRIGSPSDTGKPYTMLIPPPNITGHLHMGHGFQLTLMDAQVRYRRMMGYSVRWVVGTDHAGIATQMVVERHLESQGKKRTDIGREAFEQAVWAWKEQSGLAITQQMRRLGISVDWDHERFTMDKGFNLAVRSTFKTLYDQGLIYRGTRLVHWDTVFQTAVSDLEVENVTKKGSIWVIAYPLVETSDDMRDILIATTRPETMFGDSAIAVHPDDQRYQSLIGKMVTIPLTNRTIPIIADDSVDLEFGTGAVKITPAHDHNDYAIGTRHELPMHNILNPDGSLNDFTPSDYQNLDRFVARKKLVSQLDEHGYLKETNDHSSVLPMGDRSHSVLEPYLTPQWYLRTQDMAKIALQAAESGDTKFIPEYWINTYRHWLDNPQDWCISRQLWWGHRIPAWYDSEGNIYVGDDEASIRAEHNLSTETILTEEEDVLDTWFSSAIWPLEPLGYFDDQENFQQRYPTDLLVTGFDILFFWVARMSMLGLKFTETVPFKKLLITGLIRDAQGQKMSKSKGNVLDPLHLIQGVSYDDLLKSRTTGLMQPKKLEQITRATKKEFPSGIEAHGADALRMTFCALHNSGQDIRFDMNRLVGFRNFCNKIWNATKLFEHRMIKYRPVIGPESVYDLWIQKHFSNMLTELHAHMQNCRYDLWTQSLQDWGWNYFCDWYCEMAKVLIDRTPDVESSALHHAITQLDEFLKAAHPVLPYITEELSLFTSSALGIQRECMALETYPMPQDITMDTSGVDALVELISAVRNIRSMLQMKPKQGLTIYLDANISYRTFLDHEKDMWQNLGKIDNIVYSEPSCRIASKHSKLLGMIRVDINHIDPDSERDRLSHRLGKLQNEHQKLLKKIQQPHYATKAPEDIQSADQLIKDQQQSEMQQYEKLIEELM